MKVYTVLYIFGGVLVNAYAFEDEAEAKAVARSLSLGSPRLPWRYDSERDDENLPVDTDEEVYVEKVEVGSREPSLRALILGR